MQTSLYTIKLKDGGTFHVFCANVKQNKDMISMITHMNIHGLRNSKVKKNGITVTAKGIHTMKQFTDIIKNK